MGVGTLSKTTFSTMHSKSFLAMACERKGIGDSGGDEALIYCQVILLAAGSRAKSFQQQ